MSFREAFLALVGMLLLLLTCFDISPSRRKTIEVAHAPIEASVGLSSIISVPRR